MVQPPRPCDPNPCGTNAQCKSQNGAINCVCPSDYVGDPYSSCRPECLLNTDCPRDKSCLRNKCIDPCAGACGVDADCRVTNHIPICNCKETYTGDPYGSCRPIPVISKIIQMDEIENRNINIELMAKTNFSTTNVSECIRKSLCSFTLRTQQSMPQSGKYSCLLLSCWLLGCSAAMQTRMRFKLGMPPITGLHELEMSGSLPGNLRQRGSLSCQQPQSNVRLSIGMDWRSTNWVSRYPE